ncbi:uncharacterized [Tachysurus ichikawai]
MTVLSRYNNTHPNSTARDKRTHLATQSRRRSSRTERSLCIRLSPSRNMPWSRVEWSGFCNAAYVGSGCVRTSLTRRIRQLQQRHWIIAFLMYFVIITKHKAESRACPRLK